MSAIWESANWTRQFGIRQTGNRQFGIRQTGNRQFGMLPCGLYWWSHLKQCIPMIFNDQNTKNRTILIGFTKIFVY